jgi:hypothetical protein
MSRSNKKTAKVEVVATEVEAAVVETKIELSKTQQAKFDELKTISAQIRYLAAEGFKTGPIAKYMGKRYQHIRNVLTTPLKRPTAAE